MYERTLCFDRNVWSYEQLLKMDAHIGEGGLEDWDLCRNSDCPQELPSLSPRCSSSPVNPYLPSLSSPKAILA